MRELLTPAKIPTAIEIAVLVKTIDLQDGADLIEQYARTMAAGAKIDATASAYDRMDSLLRQFAERRPSPEEFAETMGRVQEEMAR
jgi:hypothetical protein